MTVSEITNACHVLFGQEISVSPDFIAYLQPTGLKTAYRQLALQTHPDRALCLGVEQDALDRRFRAVHSAYETLKPYVMDRRPLPFFYLSSGVVSASAGEGRAHKRAKRPASHDPGAQRNTPAAAPPQADFFFTGSLPRTRLRIGQFLFYRQKISWWTVVRAMVWQQRNRPRLGDLAQKCSWLDDREAQTIQQAAGAHELWGDAAIRCGLLDAAQVAKLLARQRLFDKPIGRYFVEHGLLGELELCEFLAEQQKHNRLQSRGPMKR